MYTVTTNYVLTTYNYFAALSSFVQELLYSYHVSQKNKYVVANDVTLT